MILGQLRMGARQAKNAPLLANIDLQFLVLRGHSSLPALAVDLQKSCDLLQVCSKYSYLLTHISCQHLLSQDAKVVTVFNMIAVPCFVYQVLHT